MKKLLITINGIRYDVEVEVVEDNDSGVQHSYAPVTHRQQDTALNQFSKPSAPAPKPRTAGGDQKTLTSPINGTIIEIPISVGQHVKENEVLFILEAMKMKTNISSPSEGVIKSITVKVGDTVESGQILLNYE